METISDVKQCLNCSKKVIGRADKKFCDDFCRNNYNNHLKSQTNNVIRNVNGALTKNRRILESLLPEDESHKFVPKEKLLKMGYRFKYQTHFINNQKGQTYFFCYDHGYRETENQLVMIVRTFPLGKR
ncbi:MAG: hypothetical protein J5I59_11090 [Saprospiraceae bacterium]|nr:hypothetical protein [Saprospiraceae bacterium]